MSLPHRQDGKQSRPDPWPPCLGSWYAITSGSHLCEGYPDGTSSLSRVFNLQKFGQVHGHHHEYILCGARFSLLLVVCLNLRQGGNVLGNGAWVNVGGNQATTYGGTTAMSQNGGPPNHDPDDGES